MDRWRAGPVLVLVFAQGLLTAGCGSDGKPAPSAGSSASIVSRADRECRDRWHELGQDLGDKAARGVMVRRAFESRWASIEAGITFYESSARADQCSDLLVTQQKGIQDLDAVITLALHYDIEQRAAAATEVRTTWQAAHPDKVEPTPVRAAYRTLTSTAPRAGRDLTPAITELATVDPGRPRAVARGVRDLALLANASDAYLACYQALARVRTFQHPPKKG